MTREIKSGNKPIQRNQLTTPLSGKSLWAWLALLSTFLVAFVLAPALPFLVLNHEQKQCAFVYGGDEYVYYGPPEPWQKAQPDKNGMIYTEFGSCNLNEVDFGNQQGADICCRQLGYTFIGTIKGEVVHRDYGLMFGPIIYYLGIPCGIPIAVLLFYYFSVRQSKDEQNSTGELE